MSVISRTCTTIPSADRVIEPDALFGRVGGRQRFACGWSEEVMSEASSRNLRDWIKL